MDLCADCRADLPYHGHACVSCALPLSTGEVCGACLRRPPPHRRARSLFTYREPAIPLILRAKYHGKLDAVRILGGMMAEAAVAWAPPPEVLIPVPLHRSRLRERGYNQALELARPIARRLRIPIDAKSCVRIRPTAAQTGLPAAERARNVRGVFALRGPLEAKRVAIVDDVMTTGHTVAELARVLRKAGVEEVSVWVCARAGLV